MKNNILKFLLVLIGMTSALWLCFFSAICDIINAENHDLFDFSRNPLFFVPMFIFVLSGYLYIRLRREMDKEKIRKLEQEIEKITRMQK